MRDRRLLTAVAVIAALALVPVVVRDTFLLRVLTEAVMWVGLALAFDVLAGYTGYLNFGHGAFFGIGAYATAILMAQGGWSFPPALAAGGVLGAVAAVVAGLPTLRLKGSYFAIATWALSRCAQQAALMMSVTGGPDGMRLPVRLDPDFFYWVMLGLVGVTFVVLYVLLEKASFGLKLKAIREDELGAKALGLNPTLLKIEAFVLSAVPTAAIGGVFAYWVTFIDPASTLGDLVSDQALVMVVFGGMGTLVGPVVGAILVFAFKTVFWAYLSEYEVLYLIILGAVIAASVLFLPDGVLGGVRRRRAAAGAPARPTPAPAAAAGKGEV
jgi:branched-chain amino acid transport system permease protein